jgi:exonuclease VII small subunit
MDNKKMSQELIQAIESMNNVEKDFLDQWHRGNKISEDLLQRLENRREKVKELLQQEQNK